MKRVLTGWKLLSVVFGNHWLQCTLRFLGSSSRVDRENQKGQEQNKRVSRPACTWRMVLLREHVFLFPFNLRLSRLGSPHV